MKALIVLLSMVAIASPELLTTTEFEQMINSIADTGLGVEFMQVAQKNVYFYRAIKH